MSRCGDHSRPLSLGQDFVIGLSVLLRGTVQEKLNWAFNLYDINKDGFITKEVPRGTRRERRGWWHPWGRPERDKTEGDGAGGWRWPPWEGAWGGLGRFLSPSPALCPPQEMLEIMKSIYDMMGRCTLPALRDSAPAEHVELFFQVSPASPPARHQRGRGRPPLSSSLAEDGQERGRRGDLRGVPGDVPAGGAPGGGLRCHLFLLIPRPRPLQRDVPMGLGGEEAAPFISRGLGDRKAQVPAGGLGAATCPSRPSQDEDIMSSMQIFENTI